MKQKLNNYDYIPGVMLKEKSKPHNFEYWKPGWEFVDGKLVKNDKTPIKEVVTEQEETSNDVFSCNHCDFISKTETGIKIHIARNHKKD